MEMIMMKKNSKRIIKYAVVSVLVAALMYKGAYLMWGEHYFAFFKGIIRNPFQVGAFSPCSTFVAKEITKHVAQADSNRPLHILEVGAGSGVFTTHLEKILENRSGNYSVDVIEIDKEYCDVLKERFKNNNHFAIHCVSIADFKPDYQYDYIISSLPFNTMDTQLIKQIIKQYETVIAPQGIVSYVEHIWLPELKGYFMTGKEKIEYNQKRKVINSFRDAHIIQTVQVYANITPLNVYHLQINK